MTTPTSTAFIGKQCSPYGFQFACDSYALAKGVGGELSRVGGDTWFFITVDYEMGLSLQSNTEEFIKAAGGKVLGTAKAPLGTNDFSAMLLSAKASGAKVIGLANRRGGPAELHQAGARVRHRRGRPAAGDAADDDHGRAVAGAGHVPGPGADQLVLLGADAGDGGLDGPLRGRDGQAADRVQRGVVCRRLPLAEGGEGGRHAGCGRGGGEDARAAGRRFLQQGRQDSGERLRAARDVPVGSEAAGARRQRSGTSTSASAPSPAPRRTRRRRCSVARWSVPERSARWSAA